MWLRLRAQIVKELLSVLRDPRSRLVLVGPPLMQLLVFSFAATLEVRNVDLLILDQDPGRWSTEMTRQLEGSSFVDELRAVDDPGALRAGIDGRQAIAAIRFPPDLSRRAVAGRPATVQVILDGRRANAAQITFGYMNRITTTVNAELGAGAIAAVEPVTRHWFNPNLEYRWFVVPGLVGILSMISALLVTSLSIARERELGTFEQLLVSPARPAEIIIGKCVPALLIGLTLGTIMLTAAIFGFRIPFNGSIGLVYLGLTLFIVSIVGIGLMISSVSQTQQQAILGTFSIAVPLVLLSGFATPVENMPLVLQGLAEANPLKHFLVIVQGSFMKGLPAHIVRDNAWPLLVIGAVTLGSAFFFVQRRLQ
ncbi:MAG: ABC transporter permease [Pseudomonadota bacterium]